MQRDLFRTFTWLVDAAVRAALRRDPSLYRDVGGLWLEGMERLARCARRYDPERGVPFEWYARASLQYLRLARGVRTYFLGGYDSELVADEYDDTPTPEDWLVVEEAIRYLREESPYLASLVRKRIEGATYQKIVEELGKALATVHRDHARAVDRLKYHVSKLGGKRAGGRDWGESTIDPQIINQRDGFTGRAYRRFLVEDEILNEILKAMELWEGGGEDELGD
jgi:DNA-directed RNA polymerase specialized sigma24 family protein